MPAGKQVLLVLPLSWADYAAVLAVVKRLDLVPPAGSTIHSMSVLWYFVFYLQYVRLEVNVCCTIVLSLGVVTIGQPVTKLK